MTIPTLPNTNPPPTVTIPVNGGMRRNLTTALLAFSLKWGEWNQALGEKFGFINALNWAAGGGLVVLIVSVCLLLAAFADGSEPQPASDLEALDFAVATQDVDAALPFVPNQTADPMAVPTSTLMPTPDTSPCTGEKPFCYMGYEAEGNRPKMKLFSWLKRELNANCNAGFNDTAMDTWWEQYMGSPVGSVEEGKTAVTGGSPQGNAAYKKYREDWNQPLDLRFLMALPPCTAKG